MELKFRLYNSNDFDQLWELYKMCFGVDIDKAYFNWKYLENPSGSTIGYAATHDEKIIGTYGLMPEQYLVDGKKTIIHQGVDAMIHSDFRRRGLFVKLANLCFQYVREQEGRINTLALPGEISYHGFTKRLKWKHIFDISYSFVYKGMFDMYSIFKKSSEYEVTSITNFGPEFKQFFIDFEHSKMPIVRYLDQDISNWRLANHPVMDNKLLKIEKGNEIQGYVAYHVDESKRAFIVEYNYKKGASADKCLRNICSHLFSGDVKSIYSFTPTNKELGNAYKRVGFKVNPLKKGPFSYRVPLVVDGNEKINGISWHDASNFDIQPVIRDY